MGANASSQRQNRRRRLSGHHYSPASQHSASGSAYGDTRYRLYSLNTQDPRHQPQYYRHDHHSRPPSVATIDTMASSTSQRRNAKSASTRTLLDRKCVFLGRYFARQFSQPVLQRLRYHVQRSKGTKTRLRLSTKGLTIGSKNSNLFKSQKAPYEFLPLDDIHEIFVDNELRSVLLVIKGLPDGHLELLTYKLADELEARLYQQTFNEMVVFNGTRAGTSASGSGQRRTIETTVVDGGGGGGVGTMRSMSAGRTYGNEYVTGSGEPVVVTTGSGPKRTGNSWSRTAAPTEALVYRLKSDDYTATTGTRRHAKPRLRSEGDMLDAELRKQAEDREFLHSMRQRGELRDVNWNDADDVDGPIRLIFDKDGVIETQGTAGIARDGEDSFNGSDHDSGIQSKDPAQPEVVDSGMGTVRAHVGDYATSGGGASMSTSHHHHDYNHQQTTSRSATSQLISLDQTDGYGNGYVTTGRTSRSPNRGHVTHQVYADSSRGTVRHTESPAPSRAQSEGGWRLKTPWKQRSRSSDSHTGPQSGGWETTSLMVGTQTKPVGKMYLPQSGEKAPPEYIVMYPTLKQSHRTKSKSASRFEL